VQIVPVISRGTSDLSIAHKFHVMGCHLTDHLQPPYPHSPPEKSSDLHQCRDDIGQKWGGHVHPSPPRGDATDYRPDLRANRPTVLVSMRRHSCQGVPVAKYVAGRDYSLKETSARAACEQFVGLINTQQDDLRF